MNWYCPACDATTVTGLLDKPLMHHCRGLKGLTVPMVEAGTRAKLEVVAREDYGGRDILPRDAEGNVVMAVRTVRDDGEDCTVYAPTARN